MSELEKWAKIRATLDYIALLLHSGGAEKRREAVSAVAEVFGPDVAREVDRALSECRDAASALRAVQRILVKHTVNQQDR